MNEAIKNVKLLQVGATGSIILWSQLFDSGISDSKNRSNLGFYQLRTVVFVVPMVE